MKCRIPILVAAAVALLALGATAQEQPSRVSVPQDLLAVLTLRGKPCGQVASYDRKADSDYLVTCTDGHRYRVFVGPGDRVKVEEQKR